MSPNLLTILPMFKDAVGTVAGGVADYVRSVGKGYGEARKKQLALVELSFLKHRRRRGERGAELDVREQELRQRIHAANVAGVFIGVRS